ncbi:unnamed protein product [Parnassius mnemosyne]|uniref:Reverse transcriptase domain-containing protein n=1 Tax=Parnassius mnemosyne TaxID=213953 RepID=A0AAV1L2Q3_9NEOP
MSVKLKKCWRTSVKHHGRPSPETLHTFKEVFSKKVTHVKLDNSTDIDTKWTTIKNISFDTRKETQQQNYCSPRKAWISEETWKAINERKNLLTRRYSKNAQYNTMPAKVQRLYRRHYNQYLNSICEDVEDHAKTMHTKDLFLRVESITREFRPKTWAIQDGKGTLLTKIDHVTERWRLYCQSLYKDDRRSSGPLSLSEILEPEILESEVREALRNIKTNKSAGTDSIFAEELKSLGETGIKILELCNQIWSSGKWPRDWTESLLISLHKKGSTKICQNYRTVALISHGSKIMLHIIKGRLQPYLQRQIPNEQAGFVKGRGTREQIVNIRQLIEKSREFNVPIMMCFVDYSKAFDCVRWDCLWKILIEMGVPCQAGRDSIFAEELKSLGETGIKILDLCNQIWSSGKWPRDWTESLLISLHKKGSTKICQNYRTVALISHGSKIMLHIIKGHLQPYLQRQIPNEQAGFVKGRGTREQIVNIRQLIEKSREFNVPIMMCFVDYSKAFDYVRWDCLWKILIEMGVPCHLIALIATLYKNGKSLVRVNDVVSAPFKPQKGGSF